VREALVGSAEEAAKAAADIGFPVVMKLASPDFPHKSDVGLVRLGIGDPEEVAASHADLVARATELDGTAQIDGVVVQQTVGDGVEMIVGITRDDILGTAVLVGTGGIFTEILGDAAIRPLPIDEDDAREMIASLRGRTLLDGARGRPPADVDALVEVVLQAARLGGSLDGRLAELDLNPVIVRPDGATVVDALVVLD
jgi:acyl-CoA synthetase (NDP forming)